MDNKELGANRALVASDQARAGLDPSGFDHGESEPPCDICGKARADHYADKCRIYPVYRPAYKDERIAELESNMLHIQHYVREVIDLEELDAIVALDAIDDICGGALGGASKGHDAAIAMETRSAMTAGHGPQDDSAAIAQPQPLSPKKESDNG